MKTALALWICFAFSGAAFAQDQQLGARTKGMGGSYTAFEDDPVAVWLNPAGIATQPIQASIVYQSYTTYPLEEKSATEFTTTTGADAKTGFVDPFIIPSFVGFVFPVGDPTDGMAIGVCFARPYHLSYALDEVTDPTQSVFSPDSSVEQSFMRFRAAFAKDFRFKEVDEAGFFTHLSVGIGLDVSFETWEFSRSAGDKSDNATGFGFGAGMVVAIYDNTESLRINLGAAYQSGIAYDFSIEPSLLPAFDMPQQVNVGITVYFLQDMPMRVTIDFQWVQWSETAEDPKFGGREGFEDAFNLSIGAEYRIAISDTTFLYPRIGFRRFDAPWDDEDDLPMMGSFQMVLDTDGDVFNIFTLGLGISWTTEETSKVRQVDVGLDVGGDSINGALSYTHQF